MVTHCIELLTSGNDQSEIILNEEWDNLGGISIEELHRVVYAQILASHSLTWQVNSISNILMFVLTLLIMDNGYSLGCLNQPSQMLLLYHLSCVVLIPYHPFVAASPQIAPIYLMSCMKQGMGLLEFLICKQPVHHNQGLLKVSYF